MITLALGLVLFLGVHSVRIVAPGLREAAIGRIGEGPWKGLYAVLSLAGLMLVGRGWGAAEPSLLYPALPGSGVVALVAMLPLSVALVAGNLPAGRIRRALGHPMMLAALGWSLVHLAANGEARAVLLFGAFAAWSAVELASLHARDRAAKGALGPHGAAPPASAEPLPWWPDAAVLGIGTAFYVWFVMYGHAWLFGVSAVG